MLASALILNSPPKVDYVERRFEGWSVHVERRIERERPRLWEAVRKELTRQLQQVDRVVPDAPLAKLRKIPIWIHLNNPVTIGAAYHPSRQWLVEHKQNPRMAESIEIGNAEHFVSWTYDQPWMLMHELAHGFHFRYLPEGAENRKVIEAFQAAVQSGRYESVLRSGGKNERAYAATNKMEYFAESTEAYFGQNDFFPFVRAELRTFDPAGYALMQEIWGAPAVKVPKG